MIINISCKSVAQKKCKVISKPYIYDTIPSTIKEFIKQTVLITIQLYIQKKDNSDLLKILTNDDINNKAIEGKVSFDNIYNENDVDKIAAINNAIESFEDGLFLIFVDGVQQENINDNPSLHENSEVTFIRMTMLSGRMW